MFAFGVDFRSPDHPIIGSPDLAITRSPTALIKPLALKPKYPVRSRPIIFPGNGRCQFHQLRGGKALLQARAQLWSHARRSGSDGVRQFQHQFFIGVEEVALVVVVEVAKLIVADSLASAYSRVDVNSKRTFHQLGSA